MNHVPVSSSQIKSVGYDAATRTMEVAFQSGDTWAYDNVPTNIYESLIDAESVGKSFHSLVKGKYAGRKV